MLQPTTVQPQPALALPPSPLSPTTSDTLSPLQLNTVHCIYLASTNKAVQVSLRTDEHSQDPEGLAELYDEVKDDVTDLISLVLHLSASDQPLPSPLRFDGGKKGYTLTVERKIRSKTLSRWIWTRDGVEVGQAGYKLRIVFARSGIGG